jgi:hypothetical protein
MAVITEALGHADRRITRKHYPHLTPSTLRDAVRNGLGNFGKAKARPALRLVQQEERLAVLDQTVQSPARY